MSFQNFYQDTAATGGDISGARADNLDAPKSFEEMQSWLAARLAESLALEADEMGVHEPFANFGLNSITAVSLSGDLEQLLGCELPATLLWDYPTIEILARHLWEEFASAE